MTSSPAAAVREARAQLLRGRGAHLVAVAMLSFASGVSQAALLVTVVQAATSLDDAHARADVALGPVSLHLRATGVFVLLLGLAAVVLVAEAVAAAIASAAAAQALRDLRAGLFHAFARAGFTAQAEERTGHLQELVMTNAANGGQAVLVVAAGLAAVVSLATMLVGALVVNPGGAVLIGVALAALGVVLRPLHQRSRRLSEELATANLDLVTATSEGVELALETAVFGTEDRLEGRFAGADDVVVDRWRSKYRVLRVTPPIFRNGALLVVLAALGALYAADLADVATLGAIVLILVRAITYAQAAQSAAQQVAELMPWVERLLAAERAYLDAAPVSGVRPLTAIDRVELRLVSFSYDGRGPALTDASLEVRRGEAVGLIGPSGAGKSTLVQVLLGLRRPGSGEVLVDGADLSTLRRPDWTRLVAFVPQEPHTFAGTVHENIAFFRDLDRAAVQRAAVAARLHDEIESWPDGYETMLAERGGRLSGGQRQRLALARALAADPHLLVLDEPTSALDASSESLVHESLAGQKARCGLLIIAHRLSTLRLCDRLVVVERGAITAQGTPAEVLASSEYYRDAVRLSTL